MITVDKLSSSSAWTTTP